MLPLFSAQRIPLMAFASLFVFAGVATIMSIPGNLTSQVMSTCGNDRLEAGEDCERGVESLINPCSENEQCNVDTCLCPSHENSSAYFSSSSIICPLAATLYCPAGRIISGMPGKAANGCPTYPAWCCGNGMCEGEESGRGCTEDCAPRSSSSVACLGDGQKGPVIPNAPQCCSGLNRISIASESGDLCANAMGVFLCTKSVCGDGVCGKDENRCNCPQDCSNTTYRRAFWQCYNGSESNNGGPTSCKDRKTWESYANDACKNKCDTDSAKCGVNSFKVWEECGSSVASSVPCAIPNCVGAYRTGTDARGCLVFACPVFSPSFSPVVSGTTSGPIPVIAPAQTSTTTVPVLAPVTNFSSFHSVAPAAGFEDVVLTAPVAPANPFSDTDLSTLAGKAAADLYVRGIIGGYVDGEFKGSRPVNRAEAAKFLLLARFGNIPDSVNNSRFPDVLDGQWYTKFVVTAAEQGIINGYPDGTFRPANTVNTAEFLKMMALTFGLPQNLPFTYSDVPSDSWFAPYAGLAEHFHFFPERVLQLLPQNALTREDVAIAIYQYLTVQ